jgi:hypothetical protein
MHGMIGHPEGRVHRVVRRQDAWTLREHEVVVSHWPDIEAIEKRLPYRTRIAIANFAGKCNLRKQLHQWTQPQDQLLRRRVREGVPRADIARELGLSLTQVANRMGYAKIRYARRTKAPSPTGNKIMDAIFGRAFELNLSRRDLDAICGSGGQFSRWSPARRIHNRHLWRAVDQLDGEFRVEWREG